MVTVPQIADGGDLEPQMFGLTTKFNKMSEVTTTTENPAIGNVLLAGNALCPEIVYKCNDYLNRTGCNLVNKIVAFDGCSRCMYSSTSLSRNAINPNANVHFR